MIRAKDARRLKRGMSEQELAHIVENENREEEFLDERGLRAAIREFYETYQYSIRIAAEAGERELELQVPVGVLHYPRAVPKILSDFLALFILLGYSIEYVGETESSSIGLPLYLKRVRISWDNVSGSTSNGNIAWAANTFERKPEE